MATNQEFFCRQQLRSMTSCSLPIKLLNCWSLSKENLPEGNSQDVTMTYKQSLHKKEHCIHVNNSVKIENKNGPTLVPRDYPPLVLHQAQWREVLESQTSCHCAWLESSPTNLFGWEYKMIGMRMLQRMDLPRGCDSWCWPKGVRPLGMRMKWSVPGKGRQHTLTEPLSTQVYK